MNLTKQNPAMALEGMKTWWCLRLVMKIPKWERPAMEYKMAKMVQMGMSVFRVGRPPITAVQGG